MKCIIFMPILLALCTAQLNNRARSFSTELLRQTEAETNEHAIISPFGIWSLMTGVTLGATDNSQKQLMGAMRLPKSKLREFALAFKNLTTTVFQPTTSDVTVINKNFLFLDKSFKVNVNFEYLLWTYLEVAMDTLDFQNPTEAAQSANKIIQSAGVNLQYVVAPDDFQDSKMILTNVITFKGAWKTAFDKSATTIEPFYNEFNKVIGNVNMMYQNVPVLISYVESLSADLLELPYGNDGKFSFLILLPKSKTKIQEVYRRLERTDLFEILNKLQKDQEEHGSLDVEIRIPRFKISTILLLNNALRQMGVTDIFEPTIANFGNITPEKIFISSVIHKAEIEVTETGTVSSASTSANFADRILTPTFTANKPFIYFIVEKQTQSILFGGTYSQPSIY